MNMMKKVFAVIMCVAMLASFATMGMAVSAEEATTVNGVRWFPAREDRQNDDAWEVECVADGCLCQRFTETAEDTGNSNYLDTVYGEDGSLTITRNDTVVMQNGVDMTAGYWPRIRTVSLETSPELDLKTANTFYFNFTVPEGTQWNMMMAVNGINIKLSKVISDAAGVTGPKNSDEDGIAGTFKGSFNIQDAIEEISKESGTESSTNAVALKNMKKTYVPQIAIFCVGPVGASLTINELYISTPEDTTGANCTYVDMGMLTGLGDEYYELMKEEGDATDEPTDTDEPADDEPASPDEGPVSDGTPAVDGEEDETDNTTTTTKKADKDEGGSAMPIVIAVIAVVVVAIVVVVLVMKKKSA